MALSKTNILVNQLPKSMGDAQFREVFESIGELKSCQVIKDRNTRESLCYGFVEFVKEEDAQKAMEELNNYQVEDKYLKLQFARRNNFQAKKGESTENGLLFFKMRIVMFFGASNDIFFIALK